MAHNVPKIKTTKTTKTTNKQTKNATLFNLGRNAKFHKNPKAAKTNHLTAIQSYPVIRARIFLYLLKEGDGYVIDVCANQWNFGQFDAIAKFICQFLARENLVNVWIRSSATRP